MNIIRSSNKVTIIEIMSKNLKNALKKEINNEVHNSVFQFLLQLLKNDKFSHDAINTLALKVNVHCSTISHLCK